MGHPLPSSGVPSPKRRLAIWLAQEWLEACKKHEFELRVDSSARSVLVQLVHQLVMMPLWLTPSERSDTSGDVSSAVFDAWMRICQARFHRVWLGQDARKFFNDELRALAESYDCTPFPSADELSEILNPTL